MKNYKINMNRTPLSDDDIAKGKNFDQVLKNYNAMKTPFIKTTKFWFGASSVLVASVAALLVYNTFTKDSVTEPSAFINPPVAEANITTTKFVIDGATDTTITYTSGSKIHVPANAFTDAEGKVVKGPVELSYREFHKVSEVFLAGIPMTYDSAGQQYHFETAGMMEIGAEQHGKTLYTNPSALITVNMVSYNKEDRFNTYYLDTVEKQWKYLPESNYIASVAPVEANDSVVMEEAPIIDGDVPDPQLTALRTELKKVKEEISAKPVEPRKPDSKKPRFSIKVDAKEFPEIAVYNNLKFQVEDKAYDPAKAEITWENVELKRVEGSLKYEIIFSNAKESYSVVAAPVVDEKDYAAAKKVYDEKFNEYQAKLEQRKTDEAKLKAELEARAKEAQAKIQAQIAEMEKRRREYEARLQQSELVYRAFQVRNFGVWNSDCPKNLPSGAVVAASVTDSKTKQALELQSCYLIEKGRNVMFAYYPSNLGSFRFDPNSQNMIWAVTKDLKVAVMKPDEFRAAALKGNGKMNLELNVLEKKFESSKEVQEYLDI